MTLLKVSMYFLLVVGYVSARSRFPFLEFQCERLFGSCFRRLYKLNLLNILLQNDLYDDNLRLGSAADVDNDGFGEVFWKTTDGSAFLRSIHHLDGNVKYANYMNAWQMTDYLSQHGHMGDIGSRLGL